MKQYISKSLEETKKIAEEISARISGGEVLALRGDLGSGKTTFTRFLAKSLGVLDEITSPTFVIVKTYPFVQEGQDLTLIHIDAYRFDQPDEADSIGLDEMIVDKKNVLVVEWPEKIWSKIEPVARVIDFEFIDDKTRKITIK